MLRDFCKKYFKYAWLAITLSKKYIIAISIYELLLLYEPSKQINKEAMLVPVFKNNSLVNMSLCIKAPKIITEVNIKIIVTQIFNIIQNDYFIISFILASILPSFSPSINSISRACTNNISPSADNVTVPGVKVIELAYNTTPT